MKTYDLLIIGANREAYQLSQELEKSGQSIGLISPLDPIEVDGNRLLNALAGRPLTIEDPVPSTKADIITGSPSFIAPHVVQVDGQDFHGKKFLLIMGARPFIPPIPGLETIPYLTLRDFPWAAKISPDCAILGAGPAGVAMADGLARQNIRVTLIGITPRILPAEEPEISAAVAAHLEKKGVDIKTSRQIRQASKRDGRFTLTGDRAGNSEEISVQTVVIAAGVTPNTEKLGLQVPLVYVNNRGEIVTNEEMRTSCPWIWAVGLATNRHLKMGQAMHQISVARHNLSAYFFNKIKLDLDPTPYSIPTDPPVARVGWTEEETRQRIGSVHTSLISSPHGTIKLVGQKKGGRLFGAHLFLPHAEEMILYFDLLLRAEISLHDVAEPHHYLPLTQGELVNQAIRSFCQG